MALSVKVGAYTTPAGTGTDAQTGMGFAPKAMFFLHPLQTAAGTATRAIFHVGYVDDSDTTSHSVEGGWQSDDAVGTSYVIRSMRTSRNWAIPVAGSAATYTLDGYIQSLNADGYTPNFITTSSGYQTPYLAIGGTDITNTYSGTFQLNSTTGNQSITAPGFQPDIVFFQINSQASASLTAGDVEYSFGVAKSSSARWASAVSSDHGVGTSQTQRAFYNNHCLVGINAASAAISHSADFVSMDTNGFTINVDTADGSNHTCNYIAIKGGQWAVGDTTLNTSTGDQDVTTTGIDPAAIILSTANHTTANSITNNARISAGFGTSSTSRQSIWAGDSDNQDTTITDQAYATDGVILDYTEGTPTLNAKADITSLGTAKFTLNVTTAGSAINFGYVALGTTSASNLDVNESENITVTENAVLTVSSPQVNESESISATDTPVINLESYVNESESITVTDTPVISLENNIVETENVAVSENITLTVSDPQIIESENIAVSENAVAQLDNYIQESESVAVSENVAVEVSSPQPSVSDTVTVSDTPTIRLESYIAEQESIIVGENVSVSNPTDYISASDNISVTESINIVIVDAGALQVAEQESITVTENVILTVSDPQVSESEAIAVTDTPTVNLESYINESESITVSESVSIKVSDLQINVSDSITVSEALLAIRQDAEPIQVGSMDSISVTENVNVAVPLLEINEAENITVTDTPNIRTELNVVESENISVNDVANVVIPTASTLEINVSDSITVTDSPQVSNPLLQINESELVTVSESVSAFIPASYTKPAKYSLDIGGGLSKMIIGADRIAYSSGAPSGNPSGYVLVFDKTNNKLYVYNDDTDTWVAIN